MKTSLRMLRSLTLHNKSDSKNRRDSSAQRDELAQASQDMQNMRECYDSLLSAAAATANSAYEFSESLHEMGTCLAEKTGLNDDQESGKLLLILGQVQFELQKLVDNYRAHVFQTITIPSESLLSQLQTVEEMKRQCDEKRNVMEYMTSRHKEKGKVKIGKGGNENFTSQQLREARDEYDDEATLFVFRSKSLKQGQSRSLFTQAARHHAAQLNFFRKALQSLEAVEHRVKVVAEEQHIDYHFVGLEDDNNTEDGVDNSSEGREDVHNGELSFNYNYVYARDGTDPPPKTGSQSAPLFPANAATAAVQISPRKSSAHVLPIPLTHLTDLPSPTSRPRNSWHSSPLAADKRLPPPLSSQPHPLPRHAFSGPIIGSDRPAALRTFASPPTASPKISELHELPRPPVNRSDWLGYSASSSRVNKSTLLLPPHLLTRSFSIPSTTAQRLSDLDAPPPHVLTASASPPLTPISFTNIRRASSAESTFIYPRHARPTAVPTHFARV